ncbi:hypothetical protein MAPG_07391 [Magnaporthiopsis poae ATCC 64411]|uniref:Uncharacterized protein n=1 Tax=Magnaporthiopsis poae (strain ATCC 64411 / 73-15) TaxID=644358 RepID=A0A0C4E4J6_MAGP6|nr:hypothetical protein MAPG_07391 [Magnaporthiopsis poae ATCC 64411]
MPPPVMDGPRPGSNSSASVSPRTVLRPASPEMMNPAPTKRPRLGFGFGFGDHGYGNPPLHQAPAAPSYSHYTHAPQRPPSPYSHHHHYPPQQQQPHHPYHHQHQETRRSPVMLPLPLPVPQLQRDPRDGGKADWQHHQRHDHLPRIHDDPRRGWQTDSYVHDPQPRLQHQHQHQHPSYQHHYDGVPRSPASRELPPLSASAAREGLGAPVVSGGGGGGDGPASGSTVTPTRQQHSHPGGEKSGMGRRLTRHANQKRYESRRLDARA